MNLGQLGFTLGSTPFFASRLFGTTFLIALLAWLHQEGHLAFLNYLGPLGAELDFDVPAWLTQPTTLWILGVLAALESMKEKNPDIRSLFETFDAPAKGLGNLVVNSGVRLKPAAVAAGAGGFYLAEFDWQTAWLAAPAVMVWFFSAIRQHIVSFLDDLDPDDDLRIQRMLSWAEDGWVSFGVLFLFLLPAVALGMAGLTVALLIAGERWAKSREEKLRVPCPQCGHRHHASALECPACRRAIPQPKQVGFWGQPRDSAVEDKHEHQLRLLAKKRCPACATHLKGRSVRQQCAGCERVVFGSAEAAAAYLRAVEQRLPATLAVSTVLSAVPLLGLVPGIIYYRMSLISGLRGYVPRGRNLVLRWIVRLTTVVLFAFQWAPGFGAVALPFMCWIHYRVYRGAFERECQRRLAVVEA